MLAKEQARQISTSRAPETPQRSHQSTTRPAMRRDRMLAAQLTPAWPLRAAITKQPWLNRAPGMTMGPWGLNYERTETWWEQSRPWHEYLARCHFLLQRGNFLADLCYLADEGSYSDLPNIDNLNPPLPAGYAFDFISAEAVIQSMSFTNGALRLPDGIERKS